MEREVLAAARATPGKWISVVEVTHGTQRQHLNSQQRAKVVRAIPRSERVSTHRAMRSLASKGLVQHSNEGLSPRALRHCSPFYEAPEVRTPLTAEQIAAERAEMIASLDRIESALSGRRHGA